MDSIIEYTSIRKDDLVLLERALRKLVEGRYNPECRDRRGEFHERSGQWTVWLSRDEYNEFLAALESLETEAS